jgi:hypothetical protein
MLAVSFYPADPGLVFRRAGECDSSWCGNLVARVCLTCQRNESTTNRVRRPESFGVPTDIVGIGHQSSRLPAGDLGLGESVAGETSGASASEVGVIAQLGQHP